MDVETAVPLESPPRQGDTPSPYPVDLIADTVGQLMEFWGFQHIMGRLWTVLFLSPRPLAAPELRETLHVSTGAVSMALRDLTKWGAVRKVCPRDSRRDHFVAESNIWKMLSRVLSEREARRIEFALENLERALSSLHAAPKNPDSHFQIERLEELKKLANLGNRLLKLLVASAKIDVTPLRVFFERKGSEARDLEGGRS